MAHIFLFVVPVVEVCTLFTETNLFFLKPDQISDFNETKMKFWKGIFYSYGLMLHECISLSLSEGCVYTH